MTVSTSVKDSESLLWYLQYEKNTIVSSSGQRQIWFGWALIVKTLLQRRSEKINDDFTREMNGDWFDRRRRKGPMGRAKEERRRWHAQR